MANFDAKQVTTIEWVGIGAGVVALVASILPWVTVSFFGGISGWSSGLLAWLPMLLLMIAAGFVLAPHLGQQVPNRTNAWLGLAGAAVLFGLLFIVVNVGDMGDGISFGVGMYLGILAALVSAGAAFKTFQDTKKTTSP